MSQYRLYVHAKGPLKGAAERGVYANPEGKLYLRIFLESGRESFKPCGTKSITEAIKMRDARTKAKAAAGLGIAVEPEEGAKNATTTVAKVIKRYEADGYPDKKGRARTAGRHLEEEKRYCKTLLVFFNGDAPAADLSQNDLDDYYTWRQAQVQNSGKVKQDGEPAKPHGEGKRITDLELNCLNNATRWAVRKKLLRFNPSAEKL